MTGLLTAKEYGLTANNEMLLSEKGDNLITPIIGIELEFLAEEGAYSDCVYIENLGHDSTVVDEDIELERDCENCPREYCENCCEDCEDFINPEIEGMEWITKPASAMQIFSDIDKFGETFRDIDYYGGYVNHTCGGHIHISNISHEGIARLINYVLLTDSNTLANEWGRLPNSWCRNNPSTIKNRMQDCLTANYTPAFDDNMNLSYSAKHICEAYRFSQSDRYQAINILELSIYKSENHIEFRLPAGTVSLDETIQRLLNLLGIIDGTIYSSTEEYIAAHTPAQVSGAKQEIIKQITSLNEDIQRVEAEKRLFEANKETMNKKLTALTTTLCTV